MSGIFKEYDIRGVYGKEFSAQDGYKIGRCIAHFFKAKKILVGRDGRVSSPALHERLIAGIRSQGVSVIDLGIISTPLLSFAIARYGLDGVTVTASHSPREYNGVKLVRRNLVPITYKTGIQKIEQLCFKKKFLKAKKEGTLENKHILPSYLSFLKKRFAGRINVSCVVDFSNGAGVVAKDIFTALSVKHFFLFDTLDGTFPHHSPNTMDPAALAELQKEVVRRKANAGMIFDGDADRVSFVDETGTPIHNDLVFTLLAKHALQKKKGNVFYDLRFSQVVGEEIKKAGGTPHVFRVGNPFYKIALHTQGGVLAGELSGHIMFQEHHAIDDGLFAGLYFLVLISEAKKKVSELIKPLQRYVQSGEINVHVKNPDGILKEIEKEYAAERSYTIKKIDGVSVYGNDFWFNVRKSQTEPLVRITAEAKTKEKVDAVVEEIKKRII